jgi:hypothetical protein
MHFNQELAYSQNKCRNTRLYTPYAPITTTEIVWMHEKLPPRCDSEYMGSYTITHNRPELSEAEEILQ